MDEDEIELVARGWIIDRPILYIVDKNYYGCLLQFTYCQSGHGEGVLDWLVEPPLDSWELKYPYEHNVISIQEFKVLQGLD